MTPEQLAALVSVPAALAVIVMAGLFLKHISEQRKEDRIAYAEQRALDRAIWENHLSKSIVVQSKTTETLGDLVTSIKVMQANADNSMTWAKEAMQSLIREVGRSSPAKE
jgi:hypothetical protein